MNFFWSYGARNGQDSRFWMMKSIWVSLQTPWYYLWVEVGTLLHEGPDREPEAVGEGEVIFYDKQSGLAVACTGTGFAPLVGWEPCHHPYCDRHHDVGPKHVQPDLHSEWVQEREQTAGHALRDLQECTMSLSYRSDTRAREGRRDIKFILFSRFIISLYSY